MMWWGYYPGMSGWMIFWMILTSVVWLALIGVAVWALVRLVSHHTRTPEDSTLRGSMTEPSAEEILRQRYARGEIDAPTYEQIRERLAASAERHPTLTP